MVELAPGGMTGKMSVISVVIISLDPLCFELTGLYDHIILNLILNGMRRFSGFL